MKHLGLVLPTVPKPVASYVVAKQVGTIVYSSGQTGTINGQLKYRGKVGADVSVDEAQESAEIAMLNCLAAVESVIGDLDNIDEGYGVCGIISRV